MEFKTLGIISVIIFDSTSSKLKRDMWNLLIFISLIVLKYIKFKMQDISCIRNFTEHLHKPFLGNLIAILIVFLISSEHFQRSLLFHAQGKPKIWVPRKCLDKFLIIFTMYLRHDDILW